MKHIRKIFAASMMLLFAAAAFAQPEEGAQYGVLSRPQPTNSGNKIEVLEFFFYGCIHCFHLHPKLSAWEKTKPRDVQVGYVPTAFNPSWVPMAYTFYALRAMELGTKVEDKLDDKLYDAWNLDHNILAERDKIADFVAQQGVNRQKFLESYQSFSVDASVKQSKQAMVDYHIEGTPTLVVDGKYTITGLEPDDAIRVLNELIAKVRKERSHH